MLCELIFAAALAATPTPNCVCIDLYMPVCGADGQTYSNDCNAKCAGIEIAYQGRCTPAKPAGNKDKQPTPPSEVRKEPAPAAPVIPKAEPLKVKPPITPEAR